MDGEMATERAEGASPADRPITVVGALAALGIVYGDLGTSPLYTYQTIVGAVGGHPSAQDALGLLSLVVWALIVTVSIKYCVFVMRADNHGEGGILALMALVTGSASGPAGRARGVLIVMGLFGAALIYGDGIITPAISVLSALEGINVVTDAFKPYVVPAAMRRPARPVRRTSARHRQHRPRLRPGHAALVRGHRLARPVRRRSGGPRSCSRINPTHAVGFLVDARLAQLRRARAACSWRLPEARRFTPTWGISGATRSACHGTASCCPRCCSAMPARRRC